MANSQQPSPTQPSVFLETPGAEQTSEPNQGDVSQTAAEGHKYTDHLDLFMGFWGSIGTVCEAGTTPGGIRRRSEHLISQACKEKFPLMDSILTHSNGSQRTSA